MSAHETVLLHPDRPLRLDARRTAELHVDSGIVWVTAGGVAEDLFLVAGERYAVPRARTVVVEALRGDALVRLDGRRSSRVFGPVGNRLSAFGA